MFPLAFPEISKGVRIFFLTNDRPKRGTLGGQFERIAGPGAAILGE
jgi:hypothetical protein